MLTLSRGLVAAPVAHQFAPHVTPVAPALGRAFDAECRLHDEQTEATLHDATVALVKWLKADDVPPEQVVVAVKTAIARYGGVDRMPSLIDEADNPCVEHGAETYRKVFAWCLDAYFG